MKKQLENVSMLPCAPGEEIPFSFTHMLASSLSAAGCTRSREVITGASGFAFRIWVEVKTQCPSATSIFDFNLLKLGVELNGFECVYKSRLWHEESIEAERREDAHRAIVEAINSGIAPVVWDIGIIPEWGLITGYDDEAQSYNTISIQNKQETMPYSQLGRREIPILSVTIPGKATGVVLMALARDTIRTAIDHARGREWEDRPAYENGLAAYPAWAALTKNIDQTGISSIRYVCIYAYLRRCTAKYLEHLAETDSLLLPAANAYAKVAEALRQAHDARLNPSFPSEALLNTMEEAILQAYAAETEGVQLLENWLKG